MVFRFFLDLYVVLGLGRFRREGRRVSEVVGSVQHVGVGDVVGKQVKAAPSGNGRGRFERIGP